MPGRPSGVFRGRVDIVRRHRLLSLAAVAAGMVPVVALAGSLGFVTPPAAVVFTASLTGTDQTASATQSLDVSDQTGTNAGWNITATSTTFATAAPVHALPATATTIDNAPTTACDAASACTLAQNSVTYPYMLPAAGVAPTATKLFNAAINSGQLNQTVTVTWHLAIPANTFSGAYASTWTISLVSGP